MTTHHEVEDRLRAKLRKIVVSISYIMGHGVFCSRLNLHLSDAILVQGHDPEDFSFMDAHTEEQFDILFENSPKTNSNIIWINLENVTIKVHRLERHIYWVLIYRQNVKLGIPPPYAKWADELLELVQELKT